MAVTCFSDVRLGAKKGGRSNPEGGMLPEEVRDAVVNDLRCRERCPPPSDGVFKTLSPQCGAKSRRNWRRKLHGALRIGVPTIMLPGHPAKTALTSDEVLLRPA